MAKLKQIDINEALELTRTRNDIWVINNLDKPVVKNFNNMTVGNVIAKENDFIIFVIEEG